MMQSFVNWLASAKSWISPIFLIGGLIAVLTGWYCNPAPPSAISKVTIDADYVGPLEAQLQGRGIGGGTMGVGYGMVAGYRHTLFSKTLNLDEDDIQRIRKAGAPYEVGMHDNAIVTVAGTRGTVISYEEYAARARLSRNLLV